MDLGPDDQAGPRPTVEDILDVHGVPSRTIVAYRARAMQASTAVNRVTLTSGAWRDAAQATTKVRPAVYLPLVRRPADR